MYVAPGVGVHLVESHPFSTGTHFLSKASKIMQLSGLFIYLYFLMSTRGLHDIEVCPHSCLYWVFSVFIGEKKPALQWIIIRAVWLIVAHMATANG